MKKGWILLVKKEMTKMWLNNSFTAVTILEFPTQQLKTIKTQDTDGYQSAVITTMNGKSTMSFEFRLDEWNVLWTELWSIPYSVLDGIESVSFVGTSKGKWFQGGIKRFGLHGMPATHGHKFTRHLWSKGNRKPRRTQKGQPHAGHMWGDTIRVKNIKIVEHFDHDDKHYIVVKWSLPWSYNTLLKCYL